MTNAFRKFRSLKESRFFSIDTVSPVSSDLGIKAGRERSLKTFSVLNEATFSDIMCRYVHLLFCVFNFTIEVHFKVNENQLLTMLFPCTVNVFRLSNSVCKLIRV